MSGKETWFLWDPGAPGASRRALELRGDCADGSGAGLIYGSQEEASASPRARKSVQMGCGWQGHSTP